MSDHACFTAAELTAATGGEWRHGEPQGAVALCTDSRTLEAGVCFVPLVGERFDGHDFLPKAAAAGAACVLCASNRPVPADLPVLVVNDTLLAYQALGAFHRQRMTQLKVAGVTGSVGKTSVKEMLRAIFTREAGADAVLHTIGNTNNQVGVAQNLLRLTPHHRYAIIEMGTNHPGEIAPLTAMARPGLALVNSIAPCHLEFLGDLNGVAREKSAIFSAVAHGGGAVYPAQCPGHDILAGAAAARGLAVRQFALGENAAAAVTTRLTDDSLAGSTVELHFRESGEIISFRWNLSGEYQALNAAAAAAAALHFGLAPAVIAEGLSQTELPGKRMRMVEHGGAIWINDAYNANPASMTSALRHLRSAGGDRKYLLVLGDMLELGAQCDASHREILELVRELFAGCDYRLLLLGPRFARSLAALNAVPDSWQSFAALPELKTALAAAVEPGATVFLKSSNGLGLHTVEPI